MKIWPACPKPHLFGQGWSAKCQPTSFNKSIGSTIGKTKLERKKLQNNWKLKVSNIRKREVVMCTILNYIGENMRTFWAGRLWLSIVYLSFWALVSTTCILFLFNSIGIHLILLDYIGCYYWMLLESFQFNWISWDPFGLQWIHSLCEVVEWSLEV